jgi:uncharacterized RDD family membrane protein YckC
MRRANQRGDKPPHSKTPSLTALARAVSFSRMFTIIGGDGKEYGPATADQIRSWIAAGRANLDTKARALGSDEWRRLGDYVEFAPPDLVPPPLGASTAAVGAAPVPGEKLPSRWLRLAGAFLDGILKSLCWLPATSGMWRGFAEQARAGQQPSIEAMMRMFQASFLHALPWLVLLAIVQCVLLTIRGQSIGKLVCGIRIVRYRDGAHAGFLHAVVLRSFLPMIIEQIPLLGFLFWIVDACFIFGDEKRCVHDYMADTKVVKA